MRINEAVTERQFDQRKVTTYIFFLLSKIVTLLPCDMRFMFIALSEYSSQNIYKNISTFKKPLKIRRKRLINFNNVDIIRSKKMDESIIEFLNEIE